MYQSPWLTSSIYTHFLHTGINTTHTAVVQGNTWLKVEELELCFLLDFFCELTTISDVYFLISRCSQWEKYVYKTLDYTNFWKWFSCDSSGTTPLQFIDTRIRFKTHAHMCAHTQQTKHLKHEQKYNINSFFWHISICYFWCSEYIT